jgi:NAD(P)-dependent dehydrogenase (short-subunit alcohol dehydrogenase family)
VGVLDGRIAIVTGSSRGIGRAIAIDYAREGASVVVSSRRLESCRPVVDEIEAAGGTAIAVACDVGVRAQVDALVAAAVERFGGLDVLVNNAQSFGRPEAPTEAPGNTGVEAFDEAEWDHTFQTGLKATLYAMQAAFPHLRERGGKVINFGSANGIQGMHGTAAYNCTKEAIRALTRTAAAEWGKHGIYVNVINPTIVTDSTDAFFATRPGIEEKITRQIPLRRLGSVDRDIGPVAVFLASSASDYMTGQTIQVDGGQMLRP